MPTSLVSTGVQFPDNTLQTTGIKISGPAASSTITNGGAQFTISDYDAYSTYTLSTSNGTVTRSGNIITYIPSTTGTNAGSFVVNSRTIGLFNVISDPGVEYLVVAGGGSGGSNGGGGGGAGGLLSGTVTLGAGTYAVVVGAGGAAYSGTAASGNSGSSSTFSTFTAIGGGGGGSGYSPGTGGQGGWHAVSWPGTAHTSCDY